MSPKTQTANEIIDKWNYIKIKNFYASKGTINRVKSNSKNGKNIYANHISDEGLASRIYIKNYYN